MKNANNNRPRVGILIAATLPVFVGAYQAYAGTADLLVGSANTDQVLRYDGTTGAFVGVFAEGDGLDNPVGLVFGPDGHLYVASQNSNSVLRYNGNTGAFIDTFVSPGSGGLSSPRGITFGLDGNLYVSSFVTNSIMHYDGSDGASLGPFASGGGLLSPQGLDFGADGKLYVASQHTHQVLRYDEDGVIFDAFATGGGLAFPRDFDFGPDGNLYVGTLGGTVVGFDGVIGSPLDEFASGGGLGATVGVLFGPDGNLYVSSQQTDNVLRYNGTTLDFIDTFASGGGLDLPTFLVFFPGAFPPGFWEAVGNEGIVNTNAGNVGIGTGASTPLATLHIGGTPGVDGIMFPDGSLQTSASGSVAELWVDSDGDISNTNSGSVQIENALSVAGAADFSGNVGIGTPTPGAELDVLGNVTVSGTVDGVDISDHAADASAHHALPGASLWQANGDDISNTNIGKVGIGTSTPAAELDVVGTVLAVNPLAGGDTIRGVATGGGNGVAGTTTGPGNGVFGEAGGPSGAAAVRGQATGNANGVVGTAVNGDAIRGVATGNNGNAIFGEAMGSMAMAGRFIGDVVMTGDLDVEGDLDVGGMLTKDGGRFRIDHPLDPANKYLSHSFVESPDMMNVYNGNVVLDEKGDARIELPEWFEALNSDFRYQLTAIGAPGPELYIAETVDDNAFMIAGGKPGLEVSWQVTGIRRDPWAQEHRIIVEEDKHEDERGRYLHPELHGKPQDQGLYNLLEDLKKEEAD